MEVDTEDMWWIETGAENAQEGEKNDDYDAGSYVTAYSKNPLLGALPWILGLAFASLLVLVQLPAYSSIDLEVLGIGCVVLFFLFVFSALLLTNEELGVRISDWTRGGKRMRLSIPMAIVEQAWQFGTTYDSPGQTALARQYSPLTDHSCPEEGP